MFDVQIVRRILQSFHFNNIIITAEYPSLYLFIKTAEIHSSVWAHFNSLICVPIKPYLYVAVID